MQLHLLRLYTYIYIYRFCQLHCPRFYFFYSHYFISKMATYDWERRSHEVRSAKAGIPDKYIRRTKINGPLQPHFHNHLTNLVQNYYFDHIFLLKII